MFVVRDSTGKEVGRITVKLDWAVTYLPPPTLPDILTPDVSSGYVNQDIDTGMETRTVFISIFVLFRFDLAKFEAVDWHRY